MQGLAEKTKRIKVFRYIRENYDIACLQETHSTKKTQTLWISEWSGKIVFSHGGSNARGVAILIKKILIFENIQIETDSDGHYISITGQINENLIRIANLYAPLLPCR